ncbi:TlpA family protein disulfide reductase [Amycolatopsis circi]|uniref:TlpA family protein disulfide reductase n=1 Tax=Amycolatopsis circi TaxID=871959 RepID=UPI000E25B46E|nr:TlpA disulfide reductase family protein [Amycolatopsis circi]
MRFARLLLLLALLPLTACATGKDAAGRSDTFEFVSPGGQTTIHYPVPQRKKVANLKGQSLREPGKDISLADYSGKVVLLNLWGAWCGPCRAESRTLQAIADSGRGRGIRVLGLNVRDNPKYAADFVKDLKLGYESIFDPSGRVALQLRGLPLAAVPISLVVDKQQRVAAVYLGAVLRTDVQPTLDRVLAE